MTKNRLKKAIIALLALTLTACSTIQRSPDNKPVRLIFYNEINLTAKGNKPDCRYLGSLVSSDGHWYNYLFITNTDLSNGAINDMHNKANEIGANIVYVNGNIDFSTSVTLLGQAYNCDTK